MPTIRKEAAWESGNSRAGFPLFDMDNQFASNFLKNKSVPSTAVYEIYAAAAESLWMKYSDDFELRPRNPKKVSEGKNRGIEFYKDGKHIAEISVGKTTTLYVLDDYLRSKLSLSYKC